MTRLSAMTPPELGYRIWQMAARRRAARRFERTGGYSDPTVDRLRSRLEAPELRDAPSFWNAAPPEEAIDDLVVAARHYLNRRFNFFAADRYGTPTPWRWDVDLSTGLRPPRGYGPSIDYRDVTVVGDVKYVWELGRMQHLGALGLAWRATRDDAFAEGIARDIREWIEQCPPMTGIQWASPMEAALRVLSWTFAIHQIRQWSGCDASLLRDVAGSVFLHLQFVHGNYSRFSSANNHLVAEAAGAYVAATYWTCLPQRGDFANRARGHLVETCRTHVWPDGVHKEQAWSYASFVWDLWRLAGSMTPDAFPNDFWRQLGLMARFRMLATDRHGNAPQVGDDDGGEALWGARERLPAVGLEAAVRHAKRNTSPSCWQSLPEAVAESLDLPADARSAFTLPAGKEGAACFERGGYGLIWNNRQSPSEALLIIDFGELAWPRTAVHGHADALSIWLHVGGWPLIVDAGVDSYADAPRRRLERGVAMHNTLAFAGAEQSEYLNRFQWGKRSKTQLKSWRETAKDVSCVAEVLWVHGKLHRRELKWHRDRPEVSITDRWRGDDEVHVRFHLAPDAEVEMSGSEARIRLGQVRATISAVDGALSSEKYQQAPRPYHMRDAWCIVATPPPDLGELTTRITWEFH